MSSRLESLQTARASLKIISDWSFDLNLHELLECRRQYEHLALPYLQTAQFDLCQFHRAS